MKAPWEHGFWRENFVCEVPEHQVKDIYRKGSHAFLPAISCLIFVMVMTLLDNTISHGFKVVFTLACGLLTLGIVAFVGVIVHIGMKSRPATSDASDSN